MFIPRHDVEIDVNLSKENYERELASMKECLLIARDPHRVDLLRLFGMTAEHAYDWGLRIGADLAACAFALTVAARVNTALFVFAELTDPPRHWSLGDGYPVTFTKPVDESHVHAGTWMSAVGQSVVARQRDCLEFLLPITYERLAQSSTWSEEPERDYHYVERQRVLAAAALDPGRPIASGYKLHAAGAQPKRLRPSNRRELEASGRMVEALDAQAADAFNTALADVLRAHRETLSQTKNPERKRHSSALWPLGLIAIAAVAHDRGIPIQVESDYLPRPWVTGELFRNT